MTTTISQQLENEDRAKLQTISLILRDEIRNSKQAIARTVCAILTDKLAEDYAFLASCDLFHVGPENDYNSLRSAATSLRKDWEEAVLNPALEIARKIKASRAAK